MPAGTRRSQSTGTPAPVPRSLRFFPLVPALARGLSELPGVSAGAALIVVSNFSALAAAAVLACLVRRETGDAQLARRATWLLCLAPPAFVFVMGYAEATFVLLCVGAFFCMRRRRWWAAAALSVLAGLARSARGPSRRSRSDRVCEGVEADPSGTVDDLAPEHPLESHGCSRVGHRRTDRVRCLSGVVRLALRRRLRASSDPGAIGAPGTAGGPASDARPRRQPPVARQPSRHRTPPALGRSRRGTRDRLLGEAPCVVRRVQLLRPRGGVDGVEPGLVRALRAVGFPTRRRGLHALPAPRVPRPPSWFSPPPGSPVTRSSLSRAFTFPRSGERPGTGSREPVSSPRVRRARLPTRD